MIGDKSTVVKDLPKTVDLRLSANLFQATSILLTSMIGASIGYRLVDEYRLLAASCGAVAGMIVATFFTGLVLMFLPADLPDIEKSAAIGKYRTLCRRFSMLGWFFVLWAGLAMLSLPFIRNGWIIGIWGGTMLACYSLLLYHSHALDLWQCPRCGDRFGRRSVFKRLPHDCRHCQFTIDVKDRSHDTHARIN